MHPACCSHINQDHSEFDYYKRSPAERKNQIQTAEARDFSQLNVSQKLTSLQAMPHTQSETYILGRKVNSHVNKFIL